MEAIYIFVRRGKEIAQAAHAVISLRADDRRIITLKAKSEQDLLELEAKAKADNRPHCLVHNGGHAEVSEETPSYIEILNGDYPNWTLYRGCIRRVDLCCTRIWTDSATGCRTSVAGDRYHSHGR